jgi:fatty acid desaturase
MLTMLTPRFTLAVSVLYPLTWVGMLLGGWGLALGPLAVFGSHLFFDACTPRDHRAYHGMRPLWANLPLYMHLPCAALTLALLFWQAQPAQDLGGLGGALVGVLGPWVRAAHQSFTPGEQFACAYVAGLMLSANHIVGHELVHRRSEPAAMLAGRWLLAANGDAQFSISHVYGHHMNVGTPDDPATARRGENVYRFAWRSAVGQYVEAARIENERLQRQGRRVLGWHNRLLSGLAMSGVLLAGAAVWAGATGLLMLLLAMLTSKFLFENVNYIQHYGLVRVPGQRVQTRHSWNCDHRWATWVFYNLARHAEHHAKPVLPYWQLDPAASQNGGPSMRHGYIATMLLACLPPLWWRHTAPLLAHWDNQLASEGERWLVAQAAAKRRLETPTQGVMR